MLMLLSIPALLVGFLIALTLRMDAPGLWRVYLYIVLAIPVIGFATIVLVEGHGRERAYAVYGLFLASFTVLPFWVGSVAGVIAGRPKPASADSAPVR